MTGHIIKKAAGARAARRKRDGRITVDSIWRTYALGAAALAARMARLGAGRKNRLDRG
jgi:hypothetical protein